MNVPELLLAIYQLTQNVTLLSAQINLISNATNVAVLHFYLHQKKINAVFSFKMNAFSF